MLVSKWGDGLAVKLSEDDVARLGLKEGDQVEVEVKRTEPQVSAEEAQKRRDEAIESLRSFRGTLPADFKFNREEANER